MTFRYTDPPPSPGFDIPRIVPGPDLLNVQKLDLLPLPAITRANEVGIAIDEAGFSKLRLELIEREKDARNKLIRYIPKEKLNMLVAPASVDEDGNEVEDVRSKIEINMNSGEQIADLLYRVLGLDKGRKIKRTAGGDRLSTGKKTVELIKQDLKKLGEESGHVEALLEYREINKLRTTYVESLPRLAVTHNKGKCLVCGLTHLNTHKRVHTTFGTTRTATGRLNSTNPNLQNIPGRTALGRLIREKFIPEDEHKLVSCDYSQVELRVLGDAADSKVMIDAFARGLDLHSYMAMLAFNVKSMDLVDKETQRNPFKNVNFGIVYGLTERGLQGQMALVGQFKTLEWCKEFIQKYFRINPVKPYMNRQIARAYKYEYVWDLFGGVRFTPEVRSTYQDIQAAGERQAGNYRIQATAAGIMKLALHYVYWGVRDFLRSLGYHFEILLTIHDEIVAEVSAEIAKVAMKLIVEAMEQVCGLRVQLKADGKVMEYGWKK